MSNPTVKIENIPASLAALDQWILWKTGARKDGDKPTKLPYQVSGALAAANDPKTWSPFSETCKRFRLGGYDGIGFEFSEEDPYCGIDLDGCRNPETGAVAQWAREIILRFNSYAEVSPSKSGIKIFCSGRSPFQTGKKLSLKVDKVCDKEPAIEVYDRARYFAVTGLRVIGPPEPRDAQVALEWLKATYWPAETTRTVLPTDFHSDDAAFQRAKAYLEKLPPAVSGSGGHNATFHAACVLVLGFELREQDALALLKEFNERCTPPWSDRELQHKITQAGKQPGRRGYLRNAAPKNWQRIEIPRYREPKPAPADRATTLAGAARTYVQSIRTGQGNLVTLGIPDLDQALGGGVEKGEMVIFAARPSHGKSAVALQCCHVWTELGTPCAIVSEEMSAMMLGKRTLQFISRLPHEHWEDQVDTLEREVADYEKSHKPCIVLEGCGTASAACESIERVVKENGVEMAVVDYAQLLRSPGKSRYEQITNTSIMLRQLASSLKIVLLVLCQLNRSVEHRHGESFAPVMSDLKDSGQLEQDADVIAFLCWPHRLNQSEPEHKYQFFLSKNRNRPILQNIVDCRFLPDRQQVTDAPIERERDWSDYSRKSPA